MYQSENSTGDKMRTFSKNLHNRVCCSKLFTMTTYGSYYPLPLPMPTVPMHRSNSHEEQWANTVVPVNISRRSAPGYFKRRTLNPNDKKCSGNKKCSFQKFIKSPNSCQKFCLLALMATTFCQLICFQPIASLGFVNKLRN